jgi:broad specificity phosphatase PhoE
MFLIQGEEYIYLVLALVILARLVYIFYISPTTSADRVTGGSKAIKVYLVRHAESTANRDGLISGVDEHITPEGKQQAMVAAKYLKSVCSKNPVIYTSPYDRAVETANIIADEFKTSPVITPDVREIGTGKLAGLSKNDVSIVDEKITKFLQKNPIRMQTHFPDLEKQLIADYDVEPYVSVDKRIKKFLNFIVKDTDEIRDVIVVTHKSFILETICNICDLGKNLIEVKDKHGKNCIIALIEYQDGKWKLISAPQTDYVPYYSSSTLASTAAK